MEDATRQEFTHEIVRDEPYYITGPQQGRPPEGTFVAGTRVVLIQEGGSYSQVISEANITAYVASGSLKSLDKEEQSESVY